MENNFYDIFGSSIEETVNKTFNFIKEGKANDYNYMVVSYVGDMRDTNINYIVSFYVGKEEGEYTEYHSIPKTKKEIREIIKKTF